MPTSIPYDHSSLVLGNIVDNQVLGMLREISNKQNSVDAAQDKMNSFIMMKRSIAMTVNELIDMNIDISDVKSKMTELDKSIQKSAVDYMTIKLQSEEEIQQLRVKLSQLSSGEHLESPINFTDSKINQLPLSSDSLKLDCQYFSFGSNLEDDGLSNIEKYIKETTSELGSKSGDLAKSATSQISNQQKNHNLAGTLIIAACCTHKLVSLFDPLVIDVDKAISSWNSINPSGKIDINKPENFKQLAEEDDTTSKHNMTLLSGVSYGSSFIGMVHILNSENTVVGDVDKMVSELQEKMQIGGWIENASGGFGVDSSVVEEIRKTLSNQRVSSHLTVLTMGAVPSIASNQLQLGVDKALQVDTQNISDIFDQEQSGSDETIGSASAESVTGKRLVSIQNAKMQSLLQGLDKIDQGSNNVMDVNSLMSAFENYLQIIQNTDSSIGVPINFYLKNISRSQLAKLWIKKYYPGQSGNTPVNDRASGNDKNDDDSE